MLIKTVKDLGLVIKEQRKKLGLGQQALADRVGVSRQWIVEIERGKPRAEIALLLRTVQALDLQLQVNSEDADMRQSAQSPIYFDLDEIINNARGDHS